MMWPTRLVPALIELGPHLAHLQCPRLCDPQGTISLGLHGLVACVVGLMAPLMIVLVLDFRFLVLGLQLTGWLVQLRL